MYVCNCNAITERQVLAAAKAGAKTWRDVHTFYGCQPQCGRCGVEMAVYLNSGTAQDCGTLPTGALAKG